jgi:regulatory protein
MGVRFLNDSLILIGMRQMTLTPLQAFQKIKQFCAYQERCHSEVKEKLYGFGLNRTEVDDLISKLIEENYLNEERFAEQFAGGRFRMKKWGRVKIKHALKQLQVSDYCIRKGMKVIDEDAYRTTLAKLLSEKQKTLRKETNIFLRKRKLTDYLLQKGYESELIRELLNEAKDESN